MYQGVPRETTTEGVLRTCLEEIDNCARVNGNPFFISILSERYGWVPMGTFSLYCGDNRLAVGGCFLLAQSGE